MSYIEFDKSRLINLEYSENIELLRTNRAGSYASTTVIGSNTRKYHGLLVCPLKNIDNGKHVLLSGLDETVIQRGAEFNLGVRKYPGTYNPKGHKYILDFESDPIPQVTYRVGGVKLKKELLLTSEDERILIKYTLLDAHSKTTLRLKPFLAFRNIHSLSKENLDINSKYKSIENGIKIKLYDAYPYLNLQISKKHDYIPVPHWYYNIEYFREIERGYEAHEDLYVPGYFEFNIKKGESVIFSAGLSETQPSSLKKQFTKELKKRPPRDSFENCLHNSSQQFFVKNNKNTSILSGFPWLEERSRDAFMALPGLTITRGDTKSYKTILDTLLKNQKSCFFPVITDTEHPDYASVDTSLWYIWAVQQYFYQTKDLSFIKGKHYKSIKNIINAYINGTEFNIKADNDGLICATVPGKALTWMDASVNGKPLLPRHGYNIEVNALWYNAIMFFIELSKELPETNLDKSIEQLPDRIKKGFIKIFTDKKHDYLADSTLNGIKDFTLRPNQLIACSLPYSVISEDRRKRILDRIEQELLTPKGIRTLSPANENYKGTTAGNHIEREIAAHNGSAWPWLTGHFIEAYLKIHKKSGVSFAKSLIKNFEEDMSVHGIGSISELYDGDPPHTPNGCISYALSVAEILRAKSILDNY